MTIKKELSEQLKQDYIKVYFTNNTPYRSCVHKNLLIEIRGNKCQKCGISEWNGQPLVMQYHHIDGNHSNNTLENVVLLCPNCHSQTENYKGKNKLKIEKQKKIKAIIELIPQCTSINDVIQKLNLNTNGNYKLIRTILKQNPELKFKEVKKEIKKKTKETHICLNCGKKLYKKCKTGLCLECYNKEKNNNIPSKQQLLKDVEELHSITAIGRKYGLTDNAVKRWFKKYNLSYYKEDIRTDLLYDYEGQKLLLSEIAKRVSIPKETLYRRIRKMNLTLEEAINYIK